MNTTSKAVNLELRAIKEQAKDKVKTAKKSRMNWELFGAIATVLTIVTIIYILDANGLIQSF